MRSAFSVLQFVAHARLPNATYIDLLSTETGKM